MISEALISAAARWRIPLTSLLRDDAFDKILEPITRSTLTHKPHSHSSSFSATHVFQILGQKRAKFGITFDF